MRGSVMGVCFGATHNAPSQAHFLYLFRRLTASACCSSVGSNITFSQTRLRECARVELEKVLLLDTLGDSRRYRLD